MSTERSIALKAPKVRALLNGATQLRWTIKPQPFVGYNPNVKCDTFEWKDEINTVLPTGPELLARYCPYGKPGDRLYVRETWRPFYESDTGVCGIQYRSGGHEEVYDRSEREAWMKTLDGTDRWRPSIHMPRWASRILLEVLSVRVERLQDISDNDAEEEGLDAIDSPTGGDDSLVYYRDYSQKFPHGNDGWPWFSEYRIKDSFRTLWESINGPGSWEANPWVWVVTFKRIH